jgi:antitoxin MazE
MKLKVVSIGNSRGIRLPKPLLEQAGIENEVEVETDGSTLVLRAVNRKKRQGWEKAFEAMHQNEDDRLIDLGPTSGWDDTEWEWK